MNECFEVVFVLLADPFQGLNASCDIPISGSEGCSASSVELHPFLYVF